MYSCSGTFRFSNCHRNVRRMMLQLSQIRVPILSRLSRRCGPGKVAGIHGFLHLSRYLMACEAYSCNRLVNAGTTFSAKPPKRTYFFPKTHSDKVYDR